MLRLIKVVSTRWIIFGTIGAEEEIFSILSIRGMHNVLAKKLVVQKKKPDDSFQEKGNFQT